MQRNINEVVDLRALAEMMRHFSDVTSIPFTLLDDAGEVLLETGEDVVCSSSHQGAPDMVERCKASRERIVRELDLSADHQVFSCDNGVMQAVCPILIEGQHVGTIVLCYRAESESRMKRVMQFYRELSKMIADCGWQKLRLQKLVEEQQGLNRLLQQDVEERARVEESLRKSGQHLQRLLSNLPGMVIRYQKARGWAVESVSEGCLDVCGYRSDELLQGRITWDDLVHPDDRDRVWNCVQQGLDSNVPHCMQYRIITKDGAIRYVWEKGQGFREELGGVPIVEDFIMDITEEEELRSRLQEHETRFKLLADNARDIIFRLRIPDMTYEYVSAASFQRITGWCKEDVYADPQLALTYTHPDSAETVKNYFNRLLQGENIPDQIEYKIITATGEIKWLHQSNTPVYDDLGQLIALEGIATDITALKNAQVALRNSRKRLLTAQETGRIGNWEFDRETRCFSGSEQTFRLLGFASPTEIEKFTFEAWIQTMHPDDRARIAAKFRNALLTESGFEEDWRTEQHDDRYLHLIVRFEPAEEMDAGLRCEGTVQDVSGRRQVERQLVQSQKMDAVGRMAGCIAHDFNNNLQAVMGFAELLESMVPADGEAQPVISKIITACDTARGLVRQLQIFSRSQELQQTALNVNELIREQLELLQRVISEQVSLHIDMDEKLPEVYADRGQLQQALMNLLLNAQNAMMPQGGDVYIRTGTRILDEAFCRTRPDLIPGHYVKITVTDTGPGIAEEIRDRIFDPFFSAQQSGKGAGLGLALVYAVCQQHGGCVTAYNSLAGGACFTLYLPVSVVPPERAVKDVCRIGPSVELGGGETVLLAEDDEMVRLISVDILERSGYRVLAASDGAEALDLYDANEDDIDLLILDLIMPIHSGQEVYRLISARRPKVPVLFCSGYNAELLRSDFLLNIPGLMLHKPYSNKELLLAVRQQLMGITGV